MNDQILNALMEARRLIEREESWARKHAAVTSAGLSVSPTSPDASCFCLAGAICRAAGGDEGLFDACSKYVRATVRKMTPFDWITSFNDAPGTAHVDVLRILDAVMARRREVIDGAALQSA